MKYLKIMGLLAVATVALAGAASAPAAVFTSPPGSVYTGSVKTTNENGYVQFETGVFGVTCNSSIEGTAKLPEASVFISLSKPSFSDCTQNVDVESTGGGTFDIDLLPSGDGTLTWSHLTIDLNVTGYGFTCNFAIASKTDAGTLTSSENTGGKATIDLDAKLPRTGGSVLCGTYLRLTGSYLVNSPEYLSID